MIPETPALSRQKIVNTIIPNTPDSSLNNSSSVDDDGSIILGTQKDNENCVFRQPRVPQQSTGIKKSTLSRSSLNKSKDSQIATMLHTSDTNINDNQMNIFDAETQKFEESCEMIPNSIHNMETQRISKSISERIVEVGVKADKHLSKLNISDKTAGRSIMDIHDRETQNYMDNVSEMETQGIDIQNVIEKKFTADIHTMETQAHANNKNDGSNVQKFEIGRAQIKRNIHDLETQQFNNEYIAEDISNLETQGELNNVAKRKQNRDISDMETQVETDCTVNKIDNNRVNKNKDKEDVVDIAKDNTNDENVTKSSKSRSCSPGSLNLSSPGVEDYPSSPLNQSSHLLESSDLLEFFGEGIDKHEGLQVSNVSTPKPLTKVSLKNNSDERNMNNEEDNDEDIFEAPTQCVNANFKSLMSGDYKTDEEALVLKKKCERARLESVDNDSDTDAEEYVAELAKKQSESLKTLNKLSNEDINNSDPGTSVESENMFELQTQRLKNPVTKSTSKSSNNQPQKTNEINETVEITANKIISNVGNQVNTSVPEVDNIAPTQLILSRESSPKTIIHSENFVSKSNRNDTDAIITTHIDTKLIDNCTMKNLDREDYEFAPTQIIGEIEEKRNSIRKKRSSRVNLNDTVERELNEMFDDVNNDTNNIHESPHMSTQYLENILESSQHDDSAYKSVATVPDNRDTSSMSQKQLGEKNHSRRHSQRSYTNKAEIDSQDSNVYFSTITTRRKRNILRDTQELADFGEDTTSLCQVNSSQVFKTHKKTVDNTTVIEFQEKKKRKKISKIENKSDAMVELNDDNTSKTVLNERSLRSSKLKQKDEVVSETNDRVLGRKSAKVDDTEENMSICTPCPLGYGQRAQTLDTLYEIDDDILTRLPAVRISGTLSNPPSPSASSTSTVRSTDLKSKLDTMKSKEKKSASSKGKSLRERNIGNSEKNDKSFVDNSNLLSSTTDKVSNFVDTSDDSDSESKYKRFRQIANRMLSNELGQQNKKNKKNACVSQEESNQVESESSTRTSLRMTGHSSKQSNESLRDNQEEARVKSTANGPITSTKLEIKSNVTKRKVVLNVMEEDIELTTLKKRKTTSQVIEKCSVSTRSQRNVVKTVTDRQSPNILEYFTKNYRDSAMIQNTKSFEDNKISKIALEKTQQISLNMRTDANINPRDSNIKRTRRTIYDSQITINNTIASGNKKKNKPAQIKGIETQMSRTQNKIPRVVLSPIKSPMEDASQEVERIMADGPSNAQDRNLSIRKINKAIIFQKKLRTRGGERSNSDTETDSVSTESGTFEVGNSNNTQFDNPAPKRKRGRPAKSFVSSLSEAQIKKKETFKKPTRLDQTSASSILNLSMENMISESSQDSTESDASTSSRFSKITSARRKEKTKLNQNTRSNGASSSLNTSVESTSSLLSTPSRTRKSTSILSNSIPSTMRHKILFTGITEDYSKTVKALGGNKVEDPAKCTILVTDKIRRTYKFLCALAKGVPIVAIDWLRDSETAERFLDWENYILKDPAAEAKFGFRLRKSLDKAKEKRMLDGYTVVLMPNIAPPPIEELKDMISSCGGKALLRPPTKWPERAVILSREEDLPNARKFLAKASKTVTIQSTEFILTGILRQETDFNKYILT
ncbi:uncharacterized protein MAL13P1.304 isoform X2 [Monomorium pharaonis]|nr:uncharacterized protein MAL13P1.304 isoform X2 [Monomorium pharaonis]